MARVALWMVGFLLLAGCSTHHPVTTSGAATPSCWGLTKPPVDTGPAFSGSNAYRHVLALTCDDATSPPSERVRVPGTSGRVEAALYASKELRAAGWRVTFENFTGAEYDRLEAGSVAGYKNNQCDAADRSRMLALSFSNVVAEHGSGAPVRILTAHYEAKRFASQDVLYANRQLPVVGANDGASGVGVWLETARVLAKANVGGTLRIVLVDGEDGFEDCHPLAGSIYDARSMDASARSDVGGVILLDMVGDPEAHLCLGGNDADLKAKVRTAAKATSFALLRDAGECDGISDDHSAYMDVGIHAVDVIDFGRTTSAFPPYWHTRGDTPDKLTPAMLGSVGTTMVRLLTAT